MVVRLSPSKLFKVCLMLMFGVVLTTIAAVTLINDVLTREEVEFIELSKRESSNFVDNMNKHLLAIKVMTNIVKFTYLDVRIFNDKEIFDKYRLFYRLSRLFRTQAYGAVANEYIPYVSQKARARFEDTGGYVSGTAMQTFDVNIEKTNLGTIRGLNKIYEFAGGSTKMLKVADERGGYYPVLFAEPLQENQHMIMVDIASDPEQEQAIKEALKARAPRCTGPLSLLQTSTSPYADTAGVACLVPCDFPSPDLTSVVFSIPTLMKGVLSGKSGLIGSAIVFRDAGSLSFSDYENRVKHGKVFEIMNQTTYSDADLSRSTLIASLRVSKDGTFESFKPDSAYFASARKQLFVTFNVGGRIWIMQTILADPKSYDTLGKSEFSMTASHFIVPLLIFLASLTVTGLFSCSIYRRQKNLNLLIDAEERAQSKYIAYLCHELRNPLHALHNLTSEIPKSEKNDETLKLMKATLGHLSDLVSSFIDVSLTFESMNQLLIEEERKKRRRRRSNNPNSLIESDQLYDNLDTLSTSKDSKSKPNKGSTFHNFSTSSAQQIRINPKTCDFSTVVRDAFYQHRVLFAESVIFDLSMSDNARSIVAEFDPIRIRQILSNTIGNVAKLNKSGNINVYVDRIDIVDFHAVMVIVADYPIPVPEVRNLILAKHRKYIPHDDDRRISESHDTLSTSSALMGSDSYGRKRKFLNLFNHSSTTPSDANQGLLENTNNANQPRNQASKGWSIGNSFATSFQVPKNEENKRQALTTWDIGLKLSQYLVMRMDGVFYLKDPENDKPGRLVAFSIPFSPKETVDSSSASSGISSISSEHTSTPNTVPQVVNEPIAIPEPLPISVIAASKPTPENELKISNVAVIACDDDAVNRSILNRMLGKKLQIQESNIHIFASGEELLSYVDGISPLQIPNNTVFMLDLTMDGLQGHEVSVELRKRGITCPIFAATGSTPSPELAALFTGIIMKPYMSDSLQEIFLCALKKSEVSLPKEVTIT